MCRIEMQKRSCVLEMIFCFRFTYDFSAKKVPSMQLPFHAASIYMWVANRVTPMKVNNNTCASKYRYLSDLHKQTPFCGCYRTLINVIFDDLRRPTVILDNWDFFFAFRCRVVTWLFYRIRKLLSYSLDILMSSVSRGVSYYTRLLI